MKILPYTDKYKADIEKLMGVLQDYEKTISHDRSAGIDVAADHFDYVLKECRKNDGEVYMAVENSVVVGFIAVCIEYEDEGSLYILPDYKTYGVVWDLAVLEEHRDKGIASELLEKAEHHCKSLKLKRMKISFLSNNHAAEATYRNFGFNPYEITYEKGI